MLELHRYSLKCDEPGCDAQSPLSDPVNFETGGEKQARAIAEQNGWVSIRDRRGLGDSGGLIDLCPAHAPPHPAWTRTRPRGGK